MFKSIKFVVIILSIIVITNTYAQNTQKQNTKYQIKGIVTDSSSGKPIEFASFSIINPKDQKMVTGGITNSKGIFSIDEIAKGKYQIMISYIGYATYKNMLKLDGESSL